MTIQRIAELETTMKRRIALLPIRFRPFVRYRETLPRTTMLAGPRRVGKTTLLLYHAQKFFETHRERLLYFSADNPTLGSEGLYEIASSIFLAGYSGVIIDEVHFAKDWSIHLKALYDDFPEHTLWISDSSSILKLVQSIPRTTHSIQVNNCPSNHPRVFFLPSGPTGA